MLKVMTRNVLRGSTDAPGAGVSRNAARGTPTTSGTSAIASMRHGGRPAAGTIRPATTTSATAAYTAATYAQNAYKPKVVPTKASHPRAKARVTASGERARTTGAGGRAAEAIRTPAPATS